jgi:hypothetical protein
MYTVYSILYSSKTVVVVSSFVVHICGGGGGGGGATITFSSFKRKNCNPQVVGKKRVHDVRQYKNFQFLNI